MVRFPNAKINIGLHVVSRRSDGYHNLETIFFPVGWSDILEIIPSKKETTFTSSGLYVAGNPIDNLCLKAYQLFTEKYKIPPVLIHLHKIIPMGAGLGGGSADGAFVLQMLNDLFKTGIDNNELMALALQLGSDCPFFILNKPAFATGRGEELTPVPLSLSGYHVCIVKPSVHVSTADAFSAIQPTAPVVSLNELVKQPVTEWKGIISNDFEKTVFSKYPEIGSLKELLYREGAVYASMSGSGSSVYGLFDSRKEMHYLPAGIDQWWGILD